MSALQIRKSELIVGNKLVMRNAAIVDAAFILSLRTNQQKSRHLSRVSDDLAKQEEWLRAYGENRTEAYFIIEDLNGNRLGTVRLYDAQVDSFCWGSWILVDGAPTTAAIESALIVYTYALDVLSFDHSHFQVQKANERVWKFHERFGAERMAGNDAEYEYKISNASIRSSMEKYRRYLPEGIFIEDAVK